MMPAWVYVLGYVALLLVIVATAATWARIDSRAIAAGREGETWRRVRTDVAIVLDLARVFAGHAVRVVAAAVVGLWVADGRHRAGREPSTYALVAGHRDRAAWAVSRERKPVPTVVPRPAPPTIGEVARATHFPADTQEFDLTFGTVEIGQAA